MTELSLPPVGKICLVVCSGGVVAPWSFGLCVTKGILDLYYEGTGCAAGSRMNIHALREALAAALEVVRVDSSRYLFSMR